MGDVGAQDVPAKDTTHTLEESPMEDKVDVNSAERAQSTETSSTATTNNGGSAGEQGGVMCDPSDKVGPVAQNNNSDANDDSGSTAVAETTPQGQENNPPGNINCDMDTESNKAEAIDTDSESKTNDTGNSIAVNDESSALVNAVSGPQSTLGTETTPTAQNSSCANEEADGEGSGGEGTGAPGEAGTGTENGVGNVHVTAATTETPATGGEEQDPTGGLLEEGEERVGVGQVPEADNTSSGIINDTDKTDKDSTSVAESSPVEDSKLGQVENNSIEVSEEDNVSNSKCDTTEGASAATEDKVPSVAVVNDVADSSEGRDVSETVSSMSCSALTSASEGSVTLDSPTSVSSLEDSAAGAMAPGKPSEMPMEGGEEEAVASDNGANNTPTCAVSSIPAVHGVPSPGSHTENHQTVDGTQGVVSPPDKPTEEDGGEPQSADKNSQEQDSPDVKQPDPENLPQEEGQGAGPDDERPASPISHLPVPEMVKTVSKPEHSDVIVKETTSDIEKDTDVQGAGPGSNVRPEQVVGNDSDESVPTQVTKEDVKTEDQDVPPVGQKEEVRASLGLVHAVATSPDSSFASSGPSCPVADSRIDPYSVALDDALGSSSFNTSFLSTDLSTDPDHTDAESAESSPRDPDMTLVSSMDLKDPPVPSQCVPAMEDPKHFTKSPPDEGDVNSTEKAESGLSDPSPITCDQPSKDEAQAQLAAGGQVNTPVKDEPCGLDPSKGDQQVAAVVGTTDPETATTPSLAAGQGGDAGVCEKKGVDGPTGSEVQERTGEGEGAGPGEAEAPVAAQEGGEDQKVDQPGETLDTTGVDTVTDDVSAPAKPSDTKTEDGPSTHSPQPSSSETSTEQVPTETEPTRLQEQDQKETQIPKLTDDSESRKTKVIEPQPDATSSSPSTDAEQLKAPIPEVVVMDADSTGQDEADGSRPVSDSSAQQGASSASMEPPKSSVVMRKKPGVRQPAPPVEKDVKLQQKIDHEIKMRDGTAKLLAASKHPSQLLEAAKNLLTSNSRMIAYMSELQRRKTDEVLNRHRKADSAKIPCKAKVAVSDIRIPLMWKDSDHFKNKGDHRRFAVFCVLKIGTQINDTTLIKDVDSSMTDLTFDDVIVFESVQPDFECQLEVYCHKLSDDSACSTPRRIRKRFSEISTSVGRSVGRRLSGLKDDPEFMANMIVGPKFEMIASATLSLADVRDSISIFDLPENSSASTDGGSTELPLFGNFCCRVAAQPRCMLVEAAVGGVQLKVGTEGWKKAWCVLGKQSLHTWACERDQKQGQDPLVDVTITSDARVKVVEERAETGHVVQLSAWSNGRRRHFQLATESKEDRDIWASALQQHIVDISAWKQACDSVMDIEQTTPPNRRSAFGQRPRSSLYEETPWNEDDSPMTRILNRLDLEEERDSLKPPV